MHPNIRHLYDPSRPVLVVDDCPIYRTATKGMLQKLGLSNEQILLAKDAISAVQIAKAQPLQLILCDYNLNHKVDGQQLLEQLNNEQLIAADCIVIIVTGDSSAAAVRGFAELGSDGYLVKPVNYNTFRQRLPKLSERKALLGKVFVLLSEQQYDKAYQYCEILRAKHPRFSNFARLNQAKALMKLNRSEEALVYLNGLLETSEANAARFEMSHFHLSKQQYQLALEALEPVFSDPMLCASARHRVAQILVQQQKFTQAFEMISESLKLSPNNPQRIIDKSLIAVALQQPQEAMQLLQLALPKITNNGQQQMLMYFRVAQVCLDYLESVGTAMQQPIIVEIKRLCSQWREEFKRPFYQRLESLIFTRFYTIRGQQSKAAAVMEQYRETLKSDDAVASVFENIELVKALHGLGQGKAATTLHQSLIKVFDDYFANCSASDIQLTQMLCCQHSYLTFQNELKISRQKSQQLFASGTNDYELGEYARSTQLLLQSRQHNAFDDQINMALVRSLTKAKPDGWTRQAVIELVTQIKTNISAPSSCLTQDLKTLSQQLNAADIAKLSAQTVAA